MSSVELLGTAREIGFAAVFVLALRQAIRHPRAGTLHAAYFFGCAALVLAVARLQTFAPPAVAPVFGQAAFALVLALPYLMLHLADDHTEIPRRIFRAAEAGLALLVLMIVVFKLSSALLLMGALYFVLFTLYGALRFRAAAVRARGVARVRFHWISFGNVLLGAVLVLAITGVVARPVEPLLQPLSLLVSLVVLTAYYFGFSPPDVLRRLWQEPGLRAFIAGGVDLVSLQDDREAARRIAAAARDICGVPTAAVALYDARSRTMRSSDDEHGERIIPLEGSLEGRALIAGRALMHTEGVPPASPSASTNGWRSIIVAPLRAGDELFGVLELASDRPGLFADDDVALAGVLAEQATLLLRSRRAIRSGADLRAREEAARLKEEFLATAAHDLRTPLTALRMRLDLLERRASGAPIEVEPRVIAELAGSVERLHSIIASLLDAASIERGQLVGDVVETNLAALVRETVERIAADREIRVDVSDPVLASCDPPRVVQVVENLISNALKYSAPPAPVEVMVWSDRHTARISVRDHGPGISPPERERIFERFYRAAGRDRGSQQGLGLGLYICRAIVEQHGGRIWVEPAAGGGSVFQVVLPGPAV